MLVCLTTAKQMPKLSMLRLMTVTSSQVQHSMLAQAGLKMTLAKA